jgi:hypothetical protein
VAGEEVAGADIELSRTEVLRQEINKTGTKLPNINVIPALRFAEFYAEEEEPASHKLSYI